MDLEVESLTGARFGEKSVQRYGRPSLCACVKAYDLAQFVHDPRDRRHAATSRFMDI
jgi:hypothetical protein